MIAFWTTLRNNYKRMLEHKSRVILVVAMITGAVAAAVFMNALATDSIGNIALVAPEREDGLTSPYLNVTRLDKAPPLSDLVSGKYDATVIRKASGEYEIQTIKSDVFRQELADLLADPEEYQPDWSGRRKVGTTIVGFLIMFILMQGTTMMLFFAEDREHGQIRRVAAAPVSFAGYLGAHCVYTFLILFVPTLVILYLIRFLTGVAIGFSFFQFFLLIFLLCALSTAFALFLDAFIDRSDSANMLGSMVSILTSILAGSFYSFDKGNQTLEAIIQVLPQKAYLELAGGMENGYSWQELAPWFWYLLGIILVFLVAAVAKTRRNYIRAS